MDDLLSKVVSLGNGNPYLDRDSYRFPAVRGIQANKEYYVSMCPLGLVPVILGHQGMCSNPESRAQRTLNRARIPIIASYLTNNPKSYVLTPLVASVDGYIVFEPSGHDPDHYRIGWLKIPVVASIVLNDGQHRAAAIERAITEKPDLVDETIPIVFFLDLGLERSQQIFADINRHAVRPNTSLNVLYDRRDVTAKIAMEVFQKISVFANFTETEKSSMSLSSPKVFTLSGIYHATKELLTRKGSWPLEEKAHAAIDYWSEVEKNMGPWVRLKKGEISAQELRSDYVCGHTMVLIAIGRIGAHLLEEHTFDWKRRLTAFERIDWRRSNASLWEGRLVIGGQLVNSRSNLVLITNVIKKELGLPLTPEEIAAETAFMSPREIRGGLNGNDN
ncbi:MAG: DNA sulfur modification protein DndB [Syntrophomonadaceae bacterium]|nr:DNA sulfur modification protein DndB [Syntrophomonadaceae bacterium]